MFTSHISSRNRRTFPSVTGIPEFDNQKMGPVHIHKQLI
jgi:hypothetical protein